MGELQSPYPRGMSDAEKAAYDKGFDHGFSDAMNDAAPGLLDAAKAALALLETQNGTGLDHSAEVAELREAIDIAETNLEREGLAEEGLQS